MQFKRFVTYLIVALVIFSNQVVKACDACGCGGGGVFLGMMPQYKKHFAGIRYHQKSFDSHLGSSTGLLRTRENFRMLEVFGGTRLGKKGQLMAIAPYQWNTQTGRNGEVSINGLGDITTMAMMQVFESISLSKKEKLVSHAIHLGGGVKLPTGKWEFEDEGLLGQHANFMPGTGSFDFSAVGMYQFKLEDWGAAASTIYKMTTANPNGYKFGNNLQFACQAFRNITINKSIRITPNIGILSEITSQDALNKQPVEISGGWIVNALTGLEGSYKSVAAGVVVQPPLAQNLSNGEVKSLTRGMVYFTVIL
jgi:hypothetical protein